MILELETLITAYIELIGKIFKKFKINKVNLLGIEISFDNQTGTIDERIKKIEDAKQNLIDGLAAIEELEKEAENNKKEVTAALLQLEELKRSRNDIEIELEETKEIISSDVNAFRKVAGVPSNRQFRKERMLGFVSGVIASLIASGIVSLVLYTYKNWDKIF